MPSDTTQSGQYHANVLNSVCIALINAEPELTELDLATGGGDLAHNMKRAAVAVQQELHAFPLHHLGETLKYLALILRRTLGGSSGPLYAVFLLSSGKVLNRTLIRELASWAEGIEEGCTAISELGGAMEGDRTMLDAFLPFGRELRHHASSDLHEALASAADVADRGVLSTASMQARAGPSS